MTRSRGPTIATVIPAHNAETTIATSLESVARQTEAAEEVVVVDDGSTDATAETARRAAPEHAEVRSILHAGQSAANNAGAVGLRSEYIAYLDADDEWTPQKLAIFRAVLRRLKSPGMVVSDFRRRQFETGQWFEKTNVDIASWVRDWPASTFEVDGHRVRTYGPDVAVEILAKGFPVFSSALAVRRSLLESVGGWDTSFARCKDFELALRLAVREGMVLIDEPLTVVNRHGGHGPEFAYISRQLEWDLRVLDHHAASQEVGSAYGPMLRRYRAAKTIFRGDFAASRGALRDALGWYIRGLAYPRQYFRIGYRFAGVLGLLALAAVRRIRGSYRSP